MSNTEYTKPIWFKGESADDWVTRFTVGNDHLWDTMLIPYDAEATRVHVLGLVRAGVMSQKESSAVSEALEALVHCWQTGDLKVEVEDEDCHTVIERWLIDATGDAGKKVHTARSRNDQVLAALRLWMRQSLNDVRAALTSLIDQLLQLAEKEATTFLPGYTHLQRAMPSTIGLWAAGFAEVLCDDLEFICEAQEHANVSPLGSAAGYGVPHIQLDRSYVAELLGFSRVQENVTTTQLTRGKIELGVVHALLQVASTINRLAADLVLYSTKEFGFFQFSQGHTTGSSIMPQKKNADVAELARSAMHRISSEAQVLISTPANLPSGYHRDLQNTKEPVMRSLIKTQDLLSAMTPLIKGLTLNRTKLALANDPELYATAAAMSAVAAGTAFRDAYAAVAHDEELWAKEKDSASFNSYHHSGTPGSPEIESIRRRMELQSQRK